jgi:hypothetical protein
MKVKYINLIHSISGTMDKDHYGSVNPANPNKPLIKHKPRHKPGWQKPPSMIAQNNAYQQAIAEAQRDYHDPVARATWQAEYDTWRRNQSRHGHSVPRPGEPSIRFLWDYIRWRCLQRAYNSDKDLIGT